MVSNKAQPSDAVGLGASSANPIKGILLMLMAMQIVPAMDGLAKHLTASYPVLQIVWARFFFHFLLLLPIILWRHGSAALFPPQVLVHIVRGGCLLGATVFFFLAIKHIPLTDAIAVVFISPLIVTALSALLLKESVGIRRWSAVIAGFVGVCIIVRPGFGMFHWASLLALGTGIFYACYLLLTRKLSGSAPPLITLGYTALLGVIVMCAVMPFVWVTPSPPDLLLMACVGAVAAFGHFLIIKSFEFAPASLLAPYTYTEVIMATCIGYVVFGDFPDRWTWIGIGIVIASGVYVSIRERAKKQTREGQILLDSH